MTMPQLAMICLTAALIVGIILYVIYLISALKKGVVTYLTPSDRTFRLYFLLAIILVVAYLALAFGKDLHEGVLALLGTVAGYMLGEVFRTPEKVNGPSNEGVRGDSPIAQ